MDRSKQKKSKVNVLVDSAWRLSLSPGVRPLVENKDKVAVGEAVAEKKTKEGVVRKIYSPVSGEVEEIDDGKLKVHFKARRFPGKGIGISRGWGKLAVLLDLPFSRQLLTSDFEKKVLLVEKLTPSFIRKAKVVGVAGIAGFSIDFWERRPIMDILPVIILDSSFQDRGSSWWKKMEGRTCLVDAKGNQLLVVENSKKKG
jgi:hypothetical protein